MVALARELKLQGKAMASIKSQARKMTVQGKERREWLQHRSAVCGPSAFGVS